MSDPDHHRARVSRRQVLTGALGLVGTAALGACTPSPGQSAPAVTTAGRAGRAVPASGAAVRAAERARRRSGAATVHAELTARAVTVDLGGATVRTWAYGDGVPGPLLRARAGDLLRVAVRNELPADTSVHWHGVALRNDMDGVPGITQAPIAPGSTFSYEFTVPDAGTYFYHPHSGVQLDRGLYGVLVVDDRHEPGRYDEEWVVVLDDWIDGMGRTPDDVLAGLRARGRTGGDSRTGGMPGMGGGGTGMGGMGHGGMPGMGGGGTGMGGMGHGGMPGMGGAGGPGSPLLGGDGGDVTYPHYVVNGRLAAAPRVLTGRPGQRVRVRVVNAASDTAFRVALGGHQLTVTHSDGYPVTPVRTDALLLGMGERFDVEVTLGDGVFPLVARAEGKTGQALALVRTGAGRRPPAGVRPGELDRRVLTGTDLVADPAVRLSHEPVDRRHDLVLGGSMTPYRWTINGATFPDTTPLPVRQGERVRLRLANMSTMFHPMHVHGHTFGLVGGGARKDTVIVRPMQTLDVDLDADNPGQWATHCHNIYHAETGMMVVLSYQEARP